MSTRTSKRSRIGFPLAAAVAALTIAAPALGYGTTAPADDRTELDLGSGPLWTWDTEGVNLAWTDLDEIPRGAAPKVPYRVRGVYHDNGFVLADSPYDPVAKVDGGYLVMRNDGRWLYQADGSRELVEKPDVPSAIGFEARASDDGERAAWLSATTGSLLAAGDGTTGRTLRTYDGGASGYPEFLNGFLGHRLLFEETDQQEPRVRIWDPETDRVELLNGPTKAAGTDGGDLAVLGWLEAGQSYESFAVVDTSNDRELWHSRRETYHDFSPSSRRLLLWHRASNDFEHGRFGVLDTESMRLELVFDRDSVEDAVWEPNGKVLVSLYDAGAADTYDDDRNALVRCAVLDGGCVLATTPMRVRPPGDDGQLTMPYTLR